MSRLDPRPNSERKTRAGDVYSREMDALLEAAPPSIRWERRGLVMVAAAVDDPHTEKPNKRHRMSAVNRAVEADITYFEHFPECTDENLLNAARTEI